MLAMIMKPWSERRAEATAGELEDFLLLFAQLNPGSLHFVTFAFFEVASSMEAQFGQSVLWPDNTRRKVVRHLEAGAREGLKPKASGITKNVERLSSYGVAFLGRYYEAQGLPGSRAAGIVNRVTEWRNENGV